MTNVIVLSMLLVTNTEFKIESKVISGLVTNFNGVVSIKDEWIPIKDYVYRLTIVGFVEGTNRIALQTFRQPVE